MGHPEFFVDGGEKHVKTCKNPGFMQHVPFDLNQLSSTLSCRCSPSCLPSQHSFNHFSGYPPSCIPSISLKFSGTSLIKIINFHQSFIDFQPCSSCSLATFQPFSWPAVFFLCLPCHVMSCHVMRPAIPAPASKCPKLVLELVFKMGTLRSARITSL